MGTELRHLVFVLLAGAALAACGDSDSRPAATATPTATATVPASPTRTATASFSATASRSATPTPTDSPAPTATATVTPSASATASATATPALLRLPDLHAEPDAENGGRIVDAEGREVLLRGVNVNALAEYWQYGELPDRLPVHRGRCRSMAAIGWNAVRLLLSWSRVEPAPGVYDDAYLEQVARRRARCSPRRGIYSILDLHQDAWGADARGAAGRGVRAARRAGLRLGRRARMGDARRRRAALPAGGIRELSPAVTASFAAFFDRRGGRRRRRHPHALRRHARARRARARAPSRASPVTT